MLTHADRHQLRCDLEIQIWHAQLTPLLHALC
jgi:hypothetical protein